MFLQKLWVRVIVVSALATSGSLGVEAKDYPCGVIEEALRSEFGELCGVTRVQVMARYLSENEDQLERLRWQYMSCADRGHFRESDHVSVFSATKQVLSDVRALIKVSEEGSGEAGGLSGYVASYLKDNVRDSCGNFRELMSAAQEP